MIYIINTDIISKSIEHFGKEVERMEKE